MLVASEQAAISVIDDVERFEILRASYHRHVFPPHMHDTYAIGVHEAGRSRVLYRGSIQTIRPNGVIVIEPGTVHTGVPDDEVGWRYRMLYVPVQIVAEASGTDEPLPRFLSCFYENAGLASRLLAVHRQLELSGNAENARADMRSAIADLIRMHAVPADETAAGRLPAAVFRAQEYLHAHFSETVTLETLAKVSGLSAFQLIRVFRRFLGLPPYMYLEQIRIDRARDLLRAGVPTARVAYETGFCDQSHLTRRFKRVVGVPPTQYARSHWKSNVRMIT